MTGHKAEKEGPAIPPKPHDHAAGDTCSGCIYNSMLMEQVGYEAGAASGAETLATARRVSDMYFLRTKSLAAVLLDARGLVRGLDPMLDERIDAALYAAGFQPSSPGTCTCPTSGLGYRHHCHPCSRAGETEPITPPGEAG